MNLESLPNEILFHIFDYLDGVDLLQAFYDLNTRFNHLLYRQYQTYYFQFNSLSTHKSDMICQQHLPLISHRIIFLEFRNSQNNLPQLDVFLSYIPSFDSFTHLRALSFRTRSYQTLIKIIHQCHGLHYLNYLKLDYCCIEDPEANLQLIVNNIWTLSKLTHCIFGVFTNHQKYFSMPQQISSSLKYLSILPGRNNINFNEINDLFEHTHHLSHLSLTLEFKFNENYTSSRFPTLIGLKVVINTYLQTSQMNYFFQSFPNLRHLNITILFGIVDGHQWEHIICNNLLQLQMFQFKMQYRPIQKQNIEEQAEELINSFRSSFWIDEHQWFVRCMTTTTTIYLYTLSNTFNFSAHGIPNTFKSTYIHDNEQEIYNKMTHVSSNMLLNKSFPSHIHLSNIEHIDIRMPINDKLWNIISNFIQLKALTISSYIDIFQDQLQTLLDGTPNLCHLTINHDGLTPFHMSIFKCRCPSVRNLTLHLYIRPGIYHFNENNCITLSYSRLGIQCKKLSLYVTNRECIIHLIKNMNNLHTLNVECKDDKCSKKLGSMKQNDELIEWLKDRLSSKYLITRCHDIINILRI